MGSPEPNWQQYMPNDLAFQKSWQATRRLYDLKKLEVPFTVLYWTALFVCLSAVILGRKNSGRLVITTGPVGFDKCGLKCTVHVQPVRYFWEVSYTHTLPTSVRGPRSYGPGLAPKDALAGCRKRPYGLGKW